MYIYEASRGLGGALGFTVAGLGEADKWEGTAEQVQFRDRVLSAHIARSTKRKGPAPPDLTAADLAIVQGTKVAMRRVAAQAAGALLAAANSDVSLAKKAGDRDAQNTVRISATSGYRSSSHQHSIWRQYFPDYYNRTIDARAKLSGGPHGPAAVEVMVGFVGENVAAPGFSNHQAGIAIDLLQQRTKGNEIRNSTRKVWKAKWQQTWFFGWLKQNAARFAFHPYPKEPWHWEYRGAGASTRQAPGRTPVVRPAVFSTRLRPSLIN